MRKWKPAMSDKNGRPEWVPEHPSDQFATYVVRGVEQPEAASAKPKFVKRQKKTADELVHGVLSGERSVLAQAITLVESNAKRHMEKAQAVINQLLPHTGKSIRIGITGVPGAGKSTFIEAFGSFLTEHGYRVAVLAVDPSSTISGGSILGDKTRMERLSRNRDAFIRPSPSGGTLGGVNRKTRETILLCEAAGFDVILVETIGVGQSEVAVRSMVDFFMLIVLTGAGDELQGMKKGVMELADALVINKADGDNKQKALRARLEFDRILHFLRPATDGWATKAFAVSSIEETGLDEVWKAIRTFERETRKSGFFQKRRNAQTKDWMYSMIQDQLIQHFYADPEIREKLPLIESKVIEGETAVTQAVHSLLEAYFNKKA